jgi:Fe-S-cluster containining protein
MNTYSNGGEQEKFNCNQCGLCCAKIGKALDGLEDLVARGNKNPIYLEAMTFPYETDVTGRCSQLMENNLCAVYDNRPLICNIRGFHEKFFAEIATQEEFYKKQEDFCKQLQDDDQRNSQSKKGRPKENA